MIIELADAKQSLPVIHNADDELISSQIAAAQDFIEEYIGRSVPWTDGADPPSAVPVPFLIKQAARLLVDDYYFKKNDNTEAVRRMLNPYRINWGV